MIRPAFAAILAFLPLATAAETAPQPERTYAVREVPRAEASRFMAAAAHPAATQVARDILAAGGSAADAAVAAQIMLSLVEPQSSGLGGGSFLVYWDASDGALMSIDGRETAPLAARPDMWLDADGNPMKFFDAVPGGKSVGVPGTLAALAALHAEHGRLPWADLLAPTIRMAEEGFPVSPRLAAAIAEAAEKGLTLFEPTRSYFFNPDGTPKTEGTILRNPDLARTLRLIAAHGVAPFYQGVIAGDIVATVRDAPVNPSSMTLEDMAIYQAVERMPVCAPYRGYEVCGIGPPSSGALTVGQILMMLSHFDLPALGNTAAAWHLFAEASRLAFADRGLYMADADFVAMPPTLLDPGYMASRAALIDPARAMEKAEPGTPPWREGVLRAPDTQAERPGTTHFVIVDRYGDMASVTSSIETGFGSRLMVDGFLLNNELTDFSFRPEEDGRPVANRVEGGKRPRSSMSPTIVLKDGAPVLLVGSPGGSRIIPYVAATIIRILDFGMDPATALGQGHIVNRGGVTELEEDSTALAFAAELEALGHKIRVANLNSGLHVIQILRGADGTQRLIGAADPRREGTAAGE
ncbi:MAG: gamma-glutamyltransferase [Alphaproteobacteria bacterium]|nr:MAG: gamma-glutamyltransferase [Alphaproteobacteria bacterium]